MTTLPGTHFWAPLVFQAPREDRGVSPRRGEI